MKTGNDLVAEQVRYSTCFCYLPNCANQRNLLLYNELQFFCRIPLLVALIVFYRFTGLAFSDVKQLKASDIVVDSNGVKWIRKARQKTKIMCNIPLRDISLKILEKYADDKHCLVYDVLLPVMCNQKMNAYLKELGDICGINKTITTHTARHTFATYALANGVSLESVAKMLGHTNLQMTRHYARTLDRTVVKELFQIKDNFVMTN